MSSEEAKLLQRAMAAVTKLRGRVEELEGQASCPIALVSMACRFPGGATSPDELWRLLDEGRDAITTIPASRFDADAFFDPDPEAEGTTYSRAGGFLGDVDRFDPDFFAISPREARTIDPQERLLLETTWETLERAGLSFEDMEGSSTGVFVGVAGTEYQVEALRELEEIDAYSLLGTAHSAVVGRLSYWLGLQGPSFPVDTACSSSLVALHQACQALRVGECDMALAGGVNLLLSPQGYVYFSRLRALSPRGHCHTFSADADGYVRAEGCGMLLLKRLSDAQRDGDDILAVIRGSAVNQDGRSNGFTAPSGPAQQDVIKRALRQARLDPATVDAVECHGTGTSLGDPIEVQALAAVYGEGRPADRPLLLGSVKTNIGHSEAAAGVAGVIKAALALQHKKVPRSLHTGERLNPHIPWSELPVRVAADAVPWARAAHPRRIGVSSFGFSGTNAHVILEEAPEREPEPAPSPSVTLASIPLLLSGRTDEALRANAERLAAQLEVQPQSSLLDVGFSLATTRHAFEQRLSLPAADPTTAREALQAIAAGGLPTGAVQGRARCSRVVFVFPGQGSQSPGMCRSLLHDASFASALAACDEVIQPHAGFSVLELLRQDDAAQEQALAKATVVQPLLFAVAVALSRTWEAYGVKPAAVIGHSQGEVAAAVVAGALSLEDGARIVSLRSRLVGELVGDGAMASVALPVADVEALLQRHGGSLSLAVVNTASSCVIAGQRSALEELLQELEARGVFCRRIAVDYASHSPHVDPILPSIREGLAGLSAQATSVPFYSTVRGQRLEGRELTAAYWADNLREPVRLDLALRALDAGAETAFLEVSGHPLLVAPLSSAGYESAVPTLRRDSDAASALRSAAAELHVHGIDVDWRALFEGTGARRVELPTYAFQRQRYWLERPKKRAADLGDLGLDEGEHPLLGTLSELPDGGFVFTGLLDLSRQPWLADHSVFDTVVVPGAALVELALHAARRVRLAGVVEAHLELPLALEAGIPRRAQLVLGPLDDDGARSFSLHTRRADAAPLEPWSQHVSGVLGAVADEPAPLGPWPPEAATPIDVAGFYERMAGIGLGYGPGFQGLKAAFRRGDDIYAEAELPPSEEAFGLPPALLDAVLHALLAAADVDAVALPFEWRDVQLHAIGATSVRARLSRSGSETRVDLFDHSGSVVFSAAGMSARPASAEQVRAALRGGPSHLYQLVAQATAAAPGAEVTLAEVAPVAPSFEGISESATLVVRWEPSGSTAAAVRKTVREGLAWLQRWLAEERLASSRVVWVTRSALGLSADDAPADLSAAALWGLGRTAQAEQPDRSLVLLDLEGRGPSVGDAELTALLARLPDGEPQLVQRDGSLRGLRLQEAESGLVPPAGAKGWTLDIEEKGRLDELALVPLAEAPLPPGHVRVEVRASGLNFRDVLTALGMYAAGVFGAAGEGAGVVVEVAPDVEHLAPGDRVFGLIAPAFATLAVADARTLAPMPGGLSFAEAATVPVAFLTALYGLDDLGGLKKGERLLVHAAAGGVGLAALQLARLFGAEVFATASRPKWGLLRSLDLDDDHIASSRDADFEQKFLSVTGGKGVDVVLDSLAGELVDASLRLLVSGGRFIEMGKRDIRDAAQVAQAHPGVAYRAFDLEEAGPERVGAMLQQVARLLGEGELSPLPFRAYDMREAPSAFRFMAKGWHTGKLVLLPPRALDGEGTVLLTGGTGGLARICARHLVASHGVRHLLLLSRSGPASAGAAELVAELEAAGAETVTLLACDVADRESLAAALGSVPPQRPLMAVLHTAGVLDDGLLADLTPERADTVLRPKVDAALHLHELTLEHDLAAFVLFSSAAGTLGSAAQGSYAAANAALDALARRRRRMGLPGLSLAWGPWAEVGLAARLDEVLQARLRRAGFVPIDAEGGMVLFDDALAKADPGLVPVQLDRAALQRTASASAQGVPPLLRGLVRAQARRAAGASSAQSASQLLDALARVPEGERSATVLEAVRAELALVLGLTSPAAVPADRPLRELGLDSLMAVEAKNRLSTATGERLPASLLMDQPTAEALARFLLPVLEKKLGSAPLQTHSGAASVEVQGKRGMDIGSYIAEPWLSSVRELAFEAPPADRPRSVLLTGATGFIGVHLLDALLEAGVPRVVALVRADDDAAAMGRLEDALTSWGLPHLIPALKGRVSARAGDISQQDLGLGDAGLRALAEETTEVISNGARVDWVAPFRALAPTNVGGVAQLLRLASIGRHSRFSLISSGAVFAVGEPTGGNYWDHDTVLEAYLLTKVAAEHLVEAASRQGLSTAIYRPFIVTTGARSGVGHPKQMEYQLLRAIVRSGLIPKNNVGDLSPVDYTARAIIARVLERSAEGTFDVMHPRPSTWQQLQGWLTEAGHPVEVVTRERFERWLQEAIANGDSALRILAMSLSAFDTPASDTERPESAMPDDELARTFEPRAAVLRSLAEIKGEREETPAAPARERVG